MAQKTPIEWKKIILGGETQLLRGKLRMNEEGIGWRSKDKKVMIHKKTISEAVWSRIGHLYELTIFTTDETHRFLGFEETDESFLKSFFQEHFQVEVNEQPVTTVGWNWGKISFDGRSNMSFFVNEEKSFDIPVKKIVRATLHNKTNELAIEFEQGEKYGNESIVEMRFFIPPKKGKGKESGRKRAEGLLKVINEEALIGEEVADNYITKLDSQYFKFLSPNRRRYDVLIFDNCFQLIGTEQFTIKWDNITKLALLPKSDGENTFFVVSLRNPLHSGRTIKPSLVVEVPNSSKLKKLEIENEGDSDIVDKIKELKGNVSLILSGLFSEMTSLPITTEGTFTTKHNTYSVDCIYDGKNEGHLFFIEKGFYFLHKPCLYKKYNEISHVDFNYQSKEFTLIVVYKEENTSDNFISIRNSEYNNIVQFLKEKGVRVDNEKEVNDEDSEESEERRSMRSNRKEIREKIKKDMMSGAAAVDFGSDSDDDDFKSGDESSDVSFMDEDPELTKSPKKRPREDNSDEPTALKKRKLE